MTIPQLADAYRVFADAQTFADGPQNLYAPVRYILSFGGKRMRPLMLLMGHSIFSDAIAVALPAAFAVEVFHNFTLLHDDIMDQAPTRRGKPTVHEAFDTNTAILSGDVMMIYAYRYLIQNCSDVRLRSVLSVFNRAAIQVCEGQQMDMDFEKRHDDVTLEEYVRMIELKTAVLPAAAIQIGAILGKATDVDAEHLYEFGRALGIAFQIKDDVLDTYGDPEKFGKKVGGDIAQNKKTFLFLSALQKADPDTHTELLALLNEPDEATKIARVTAIFTKLGVEEEAERHIQHYYAAALTHLRAISRKDKIEMLETFAADLMQREH